MPFGGGPQYPGNLPLAARSPHPTVENSLDTVGTSPEKKNKKDQVALNVVMG